jgi:hypothetical protein
MRRLKIIGTTTAVVVLAASLGATAAADPPAGAVPLATGTSSLPWTIGIVGTTATHAVYTRDTSGGGDFNPLEPPPASLPLAGGPAEELSLPPGRLEVAGDVAISMDQFEGTYTWQNLTTGATGEASGPSRTDATFGPHGASWVEQSGEDSTIHLYTENLQTGAIQDWGTLPELDSPWLAQVLDSPEQMVVVSDDAERIVRSLPGGGFTTIPFADAEKLTSCPAITSDAIGCYGPGRVERIPLDGGSPIVFKSDAFDVAVSTSTTAWTSINNNEVSLLTAPAGGGVVTASRLHPTIMYETDTLTSAGPNLLVVGGETVPEAGLYSTPDGDNPALIAKAGATPLQTVALSVTPGRVAWIDNDTEAWPVRTRRVDNDGGSLRMGSTRVPVHATPYLARLIASGPDTVYTTDGSLNERGAPQTVIHLTGRGGDLVVGTASELGTLQASGNRLLWTDHPADSKKIVLHDLVSGVSRVVTGLGTDPRSYAVSLWGDYLAFVKVDGSVWRRNLTTAVTMQLASAGSSVGDVRTWGDWVAWVTGYDEDGEPVWTWRNATTGPAQQVPYPLIALTSEGAIVKNGPELSWEHGPVGVLAYGATEAQPLADDVRYDGVGVAASTAAWIDGTSRTAFALALPQTPNRPRSLGNPDAPRLPDGSGNWYAAIPASAPLTTCEVQIKSGAEVVQTVPCDPAAMRQGVAQVAWVDQSGEAGSLPPGPYVWTLLAGNADGSVLAADGSTAPVTGTVYIPTQTFVTKQPVNTTVFAFKTAKFVAAASGIPTPAVQWQVTKDNGAHWTNIPGATSPTYSFVARGAQNGHLFRARFDNGWTTDISFAARLTVRRVSTALSIARSAGTVTAGQPVTLSGKLRRSGTTTGIGAARVKLYRRAHGATRWVYWKTVTTSATGSWRTVTSPARSTDYTARYAGTPDYVPSASGNVTVVVRR